ncbi:MAG: SDR family oxidoreductase [Deltaproteobacteria bacterium]|nr:SDR family oxidoreductase [Deltaproteobacteria bacterium]
MELESMTIVITGAGSGIGHALSLGFLKDKATVMAVDINPEGLKPLEEKGAITKIADVAEAQQVKGVVQAAVEEMGRLDVLINNAGLGFRTLLAEIEPELLEKVIRVNLLGPIFGMRFAIPVMREQKFGRIINLLSRGAETGGAGMLHYGSSKAGLWAATRHAANETIGENIRVNGLIPGPTKTGMMPVGQDPSVVYPTARMLATLPADGPTGRVFWDEKEYFMFNPENETFNLYPGADD